MGDAETDPTVRLVRGRATDEELAALVALLELTGTGTPVPAGEDPARTAPAAGWRRPLSPSPESWARPAVGWGA